MEEGLDICQLWEGYAGTKGGSNNFTRHSRSISWGSRICTHTHVNINIHMLCCAVLCYAVLCCAVLLGSLGSRAGVILVICNVMKQTSAQGLSFGILF